jgi:hypothetical protein
VLDAGYVPLNPTTDFLVIVVGIDLVRRVDHMRRAMGEVSNALTRRSADEVWYHAEAFLASAAAISVTFWPSRNKPPHSTRAKTLKRLFNVLDDSPLRQRTVRNAFVHFDERLDKYLAGGIHVVIDSNISDRPPGETIVGAKALRHLDRASMTVSYLDDAVRLPELMDAGNQLLSNMRGVTRTLDAVIDGIRPYGFRVSPPRT